MKRQTRVKLLSVFASLIISLLVSEASLRLIGYRPNTMNPAMFVATNNPLCPYQLRKDYDGYYAGANFHVDSNGYRRVIPSNASIKAKQGAGASRVVLLLGDSVVFGQGLDDRETIASQLQRTCLEHGLDYQIQNIGVPGYSSWNEYAAFADYLKNSSPTDVVVLYIANDVTSDNDYFGIGRGNVAAYSGNENLPHRLTRFLYSHVYVADLISESIKKTVAALEAKGTKKPNNIDVQVNKPALDYSMDALTRIQELGKQKNANISVAIYRDVACFDQGAQCPDYEKAITSSLGLYHISSFVVKSHTENLSPSEIRVRWNDPHPSAKATKLIADEILAHLSTKLASSNNQ